MELDNKLDYFLKGGGGSGLSLSGIWPILCQLMAILAKLLDMDFNLFCPINFDILTNDQV